MASRAASPSAACTRARASTDNSSVFIEAKATEVLTGRQAKAGHVYLWGIGPVFATATVMAAIRWREDWHLFAIAAVAFSLAMFGWRARRRLRPGWARWHATGMGGSYIGLLTGLYVDN